MQLENYAFLIGVIVGIMIGVILALIYVIHTANGDDTEDPGRPHPSIDQLLKRAQEWNIQKAINETLATAERFQK